MNADVLIIGGGPSGSTAGTLLRKYNPDLHVTILEREIFPRDHVGESQLPEISEVLDEMGCWDKVEAANFPIKIGATYRWGSTKDLWDFEFYPADKFVDEPRPAKFEGQRAETAFQVDRAIYDDILLRHAAEMGCEVRQGTRVQEIRREGDRVTGVVLADGEVLTARHYIDASGNAAILRRGMGVEVEEPTVLQNIAIWDYWENAEWAVEIGVGATRVQVMSLGYGWIWFIPLGPTRSSVGLVLPATFYKQSKKRPRELYEEALAAEPRIRGLLQNATCEHKLASTKDWSFVAQRWVGENWFLVGESGGFADPILAAGMTLAHTSARDAAYTILELDRGAHDSAWLRERFERDQSKRVRQHMMFAEFWYTANGQFEDLKKYCSEIAQTSGLVLDADKAFQWLGTGGFAHDTYGSAGIGFFSLESIKQVMQQFTDTPATWQIGSNNVFKFNVKGATKTKVGALFDGRIYQEDCLIRDNKELPFTGLYGVVIQVLHQHGTIMEIARGLVKYFEENPWLEDTNDSVRYAFHTLEGMITLGWVDASYDPSLPLLRFLSPTETACIHPNRDAAPEMIRA
jgi:flavin-dependent dehydrogenase